MTILFFVYLGAAVLGVALARDPLDRRGFWIRWAILSAALAAILLSPALLNHVAPTEGAVFGPMVIAILFIGVVVLPVAFVVAFLWQGRRMIDAAGSKWWGLFGLIPLAFVLFGVLPSRPADRKTEKKTIDVFR